MRASITALALAILLPGAARAGPSEPAKPVLGTLTVADSTLPEPYAADPNTTELAIGFGFAGMVAEPEGGDEIQGDGFYVTVRARFPGGFFLRLCKSKTSDNEAGSVEDNLERADLSGGYQFLRNRAVRPFIHAGIASVQVEERAFGVETIDDMSTSVTGGGGLEAGKGHHAFYLDLNFDRHHTEAHLGYLYRF